MKPTAPYTAFGKTLDIPVKVYVDAKYVDCGPDWDATIWVETGECWYQFSGLRGKRVRVIERSAWLDASRKKEREADERH